MATSSQIRKRRLGGSSLEVTPIGLGVMQFSGGRGILRAAFPDLPQAEMNAIVRTALEAGINWFDTAEIYGFGRSERALATALKAAGRSDDEVVVATKWFPLFRRAGHLTRTIQDRLRFLDGYSIDLYMIHQPWGRSAPEAEMDAMADLVEADKIRAVGVSNFSAERMRRAYRALQARGIPLAVNQVRYSLLHREIETNGVLATARDLGVTIVAYTPLDSGLLTGQYHKDPALLDRKPMRRRMMLRGLVERTRPLIRILDDTAARHGATPGQVALSWLIHAHGEAVVAIPGATKALHAEQNAGAMGLRLSDEEMDRLEKTSRAVTRR
jgi:aryl-alcohol dehydrogenase-like predicted oxidoreductase